MILSYRTMSMPELGARFALRAVVHPQYRVHVVDNSRVIADDALLKRAAARKGHLGRPVVTAVLAGRARIRAFGREQWLEPGDIGLVGNKEEIEIRQEGETFRSIAFEWEPETSFGGSVSASFEVTRLPRLLPHLTIYAERLLALNLSQHEAADHVHGVLTLLAAEGLPVRAASPTALVASVSEQEVRLSEALDLALSNLSAQPMIVDLDRALGVSARQLTRLVSAFNARYGFNATNWQDTRTRRRLLIGAAFMACKGARTELVARRVGYSSPSAFCRALDVAGLPTPQQVSDVVHALA